MLAWYMCWQSVPPVLSPSAVLPLGLTPIHLLHVSRSQLWSRDKEAFDVSNRVLTVRWRVGGAPGGARLVGGARSGRKGGLRDWRGYVR